MLPALSVPVPLAMSSTESKGRCAVVFTPVKGAMLARDERLRTQVAGIRLLPGVQSSVASQARQRAEPLAAQVADEGLGVAALVGDLVLPLGELPLAHAALVRPLSGVRAQVSLHVPLGPEAPLALRAADFPGSTSKNYHEESNSSGRWL